MRRAPLALALGALLAGCGQDSVQPVALGGNGSETTNGFTLLVVNTEGIPASSVQVHIRPSDSLAGSWGDSLSGHLRTRLDTASDDEGHVNVSGLVRGSYTVELRQGDSRSLTRQTALPESPYGGRIQLSQASTPWFTDIRLANARLTLQGVDRAATANASGSVKFDSLPTGTYAFRAWKNGTRLGNGTFLAQTGTSAILLSFELAGSENDPTAFKHAAALTLNASVGNGNVRGSFKDYPVPLVLNSSNFDFTGAASNALKFVSPRGTVLAYDVESWDATTRSAKLWIKMDSVQALTDNQITQMYWGGTVQPSGGTIFDTDNGWWGVWHLRRSLKDATPWQRTAIGTPAGMDGWTSNGTNTLTLPSLPAATDSGFTVSLWMLPDTAQRAGAQILTQLSSTGTPFALRMGPFSTWIETHYPNGTTQDNQFPTTSAPGEWLFVTVTYERKSDVMRLYLNGQECGDPATGLNATNVKMDGALILGGRDSSGIGFKGLVKEVRVSSKPRSAEWINAEYIFESSRTSSRVLSLLQLR